MLCGELPCECNGKPKGVRKTAAARPVESGNNSTTRLSGQVRAVPSRTKTNADYTLVAALRALEPILHPDEKVKYAPLLASPVTPAERAATWRERRRDVTTRSA